MKIRVFPVDFPIKPNRYNHIAMTSRAQSIYNILECQDPLVQLIESRIGVGIRDWRDTKWGDGTIRIPLPKDRYSKERIERIMQAYRDLDWDVELKPQGYRSGDDYTNWEWLDLIVMK